VATKIDHIISAYSQLRISGITVQPTAGHVVTALARLEDMMSELEALRGVCVGYNFEDIPDANSPSGVERGMANAINKNLAVQLIADFNKVVPQALTSLANSAMSALVSFVVSRDTRQVQPSKRMPIGSGYRYINRYYRYERPNERAPNKCTTNALKVDEINDYTEHFESYLEGETITTSIIDVSVGLVLVSDSNTDTDVLYRVKGTRGISQGSKQQVVITVTTSTGRITIKAVDFNITEIDEI